MAAQASPAVALKVPVNLPECSGNLEANTPTPTSNALSDAAIAAPIGYPIIFDRREHLSIAVGGGIQFVDAQDGTDAGT